MEIRNGAEELKALLGLTPASTASRQVARGTGVEQKPFAGDHATLSGVGTEVSSSAAEEGVRAEKVAAVRAALASGTYNVSAAAVAGKLVNAMMAGGLDE